MKAIEVTGIIKKQQQLLELPLPIKGPSRVRALVLMDENTEIEESEGMAAAASNSAFAFRNDPVENIYSASDGKPFG